MKKLYLLSLLMLSCVMVFAQSKTVTGTVTSDGNPIESATVVVTGAQVGALTDANGQFKIEVPEGYDNLTISYVGFGTERVNIGSNSVVDVNLAQGYELDEVVVTALGVTREEKSLGYAVQEVSGDALNKARETNVINNLQGKVAGVQIQGSSNLGGSSRILLRGASSVLGNNQPLFVIDGVPIDNSNFGSYGQQRGTGGYDYGNAAQDINPDDVESMTVLKGASATALYGSRAMNGAIIITTKKGKKGANGPIGISVNSGFSTQNVYILPDYQNEYGASIIDTLNGNLIPDYALDGSWGPKLDGSPARHWDSWYNDANEGEARPWSANPDNVRSFFETGYTINNSIALSGASDDANFRLGYANLNQRGTQVNSKLARNTLSFNGNLDLSERIHTGVSANYVRTDAVGRPQTGYSYSVMSQFNQWYQRQLDTERLKEYKNADGTQRTWNRFSSTNPNPKYFDNPYWDRYENVQNDNRDRVYGNISVGYDFTDWLTLTGRAMTDFYTDRREERFAVGGVNIPSYSEAVRQVNENNFDMILRASPNVSDDFSLDAFVGGNVRTNTYSRNIGSTQGGLNVPGFYNLQNSASEISTDDFSEEQKINSLFGSASLGYKGFAFLDVTGRNDWSSTLPLDNNSYFYPSVTASFVFSELINSSFLSFGKIRAGWANVGNDTDPYNLQNVYTANSNFGSNPNFTIPNSLLNPNLRPENAASWEVGAVINFLNNRVNLDATYYNTITTDQIFAVSQSAASGYSSGVVNAGKMKNAGIELMLGLVPVKTDAFRWDINFNFAKNNNEVVELLDGVDNIRIGSLFGVTLEHRPGQAWGSFVGYDFVYDDAGNKLTDGGAYITTDEVVPLGSILADYTGGVSNTFSFKGVSLSALVDFQKGGRLHSYSNQWGKYSGTLIETVADNIREDGITVEGVKVDSYDADGQPISSGVANDVNIDANTHFFLNQGYVVHAADNYDASFVKLREMRLTYEFPRSFTESTPFQGFALSLVGRNLALLHSNVPHIDPEAAVSSGNIQGFEGGQLPSERSIGINLNFKL